MKRALAARPPAQRVLAAAAGALGIGLLSPWPGPQAVLHAAFIFGLALDPESALLTAVWAAAGGWILEGSLRIYPHHGGTAWADMTLALAAWWLLREWAVDDLRAWMGRQALLAAVWIPAVHLAVRLAAGPHLWGSGWIWIAVTLPAWSWLGWRWLRPAGR